ncbi:PAS domain S-box protein [Leptolyngbya sp. AN02str]|uniref:PAS domain S-box protein n=1 Tax=Leptolyngbya sp. AN02str TaxID=3423363 RepID=UPI003D31127B
MKILVVEDDSSVVQALQLLLSNYGYAVDIAADGEAGLEMMETFAYDLVLLDVFLPRLDGLSVCQQLRAKGIQVPILLLTGQGGGQQKALALNAGADDYVVKPFDAEELVARVQALLRRGGVSRQPVLTWGNLSVDPSGRTVNYGTHLLSLTPKEYAILELFLRKPQQVFSARVILDSAWNSVESPGEEAVRVHIKELRHKLAAAGAPKDFIKTVHRVGYRLNLLYSNLLATQAVEQPSMPQIAELTAVNEDLRAALNQLQVTQTELNQKNQELEAAYQSLEQERFQMQVTRDELELRVAERTAEIVRANQALQQQHERWQALFDYALDAIVIADDEGRFVDANPAACRLFGVARDELPNVSIADFAEPGQGFPQLWQAFLHRGELSGELCLCLPDGSTRQTEFSAIANFVPGRHLSILRDVSERKRLEYERHQVERALQQSEEQLRLALELNSTGIWDWDLEQDTVSWTTNHYHLLGYEPGSVEPTSQRWRDRVHPDDLDEVEQQISQSLAAQADFMVEYRVVWPDGRIRWLLGKGRGIYNAAGQPVRMVGMVFDVSDRKAAQLNDQFLNELDFRLRQLPDVDAMLHEAIRSVGIYLNVERAFWHEIDVLADRATTIHDWRQQPDIPSAVGTYRLSEVVLPGLLAQYQAGQPVVISDMATYPHTAPFADSFAACHIGALVGIPYILQGQWVAVLAVSTASPRVWLPDQVSLLQAMVGRLWSIIEQARAVQALRDSEARYRSLFHSIDQGFCVLELIFDQQDNPVDYRFLEISPTFEQQTGLVNALGKRARELVPNLEDQWFQIYGKVALTGESLRFENYSQEMNRWFDGFAFRLGDPTQRQVALLFQDVSDRKRREAHAAFLAEVTEACSWLSTSDDIMHMVGAKIGAYFKIANCLFAEIDESQNRAIVHYNWHTTDTPNLVGVYCLSDFITEEFQHMARAGHAVIVCDTDTDPRTQHDSHATLHIRSFVTIPFLRNGEWKYFFTMTDVAPRTWCEDEIDLMFDLTNQIFPRIERARIETTLRKNEHLLRLALAGAQAGSWDWDMTTGQLFWSPETYRMYGLAPTEAPFLYDEWYNTALHPDDRPWLNDYLMRLVDQHQPNVQLEFRAVHPQRGVRWVLALGHLTFNEQQEPTRLTGIHLDITARKQLELALRGSEMKLNQILNSAAAAIASFRVFDNRDWEYEYWSAGCETLFGYSLAELVAHKTQWLEHIHPGDCETLSASLFEAFFEERDITVEYRFHHQDGSLRWISSAYTSQKMNSTCWMVTAVSHDITARKQAEMALRDSEERFRNMADHAPVMVWMTDETGYCTFLSETWYQFTGQTEEAATGFGWLDAVHPDDRDQVRRAFMAANDHMSAFELEYRLRRHDGEYRWVVDAASPWTGAGGEYRGYIGSAIDIGDRKQTELILQRQIQQEYLLADMAQDIRRSLSLENVLSRTVERVREVLNTDRVIIFRFRSDWQGEVMTESVGKGWPTILHTTIADPCFSDRYVEPYRQGRIATIADVERDVTEPCYAELLLQFQIKANLVVPILQGDNLWGLLIAHHCSAPRQWQTAEIALLQRLATQVGIAIQQSELYEQTRHELAERDRMQTVLEENEERFRSLNAAAPIAICQANADGLCLYCNARWQQMSGLTFEESLGQGWLNAVHPEDQAVLVAAWEEYVLNGGDFFLEFRLLRPDGDVRWVATRAAAMRSAAGDVIGYVSIGEDVTERKQTEQALRESEQRLQTILDNSPAVIYLIDPHDRLLLGNRIYAELLSMAPETLVGKSIYELWPEEEARVFAANNKKVMETGQLLQVEETAVLADGLHTYLTVKFPLCDATGKPYALCGISTDITERKQLETQFYHAQRIESLGTLASGIAHDLNNALTPILAIAQLLRLKHTDLDARSQEMLQVLSESAKRAATMVKQILTFARGTDDKRILLEVAPLLQDVVKVIQQTFPKSITIRETIPEEPLWLVSADPTHLHQVLMNLCVNARDAMPHGGVLTLSAENMYVDGALAELQLNSHMGNYVVITIADTGIGIAPEVRDRIFEPFFTTKEPGKGTGLGLSTVLGIVKNYGGFLQVSSQVNQGSQFKVFLPMAEGAVEGTPSEQELLYGNGERILIVDDDIAVRQTNQSLLESHRYTTLTANDGIDAIALYSKHQQEIDIVLMDVMMPNMDGVTAIRTLCKINPMVKIIAISGLPTNGQSVLAAGADVFLLKPYSMEELLKHLHSMVHSS